MRGQRRESAGLERFSRTVRSELVRERERVVEFRLAAIESGAFPTRAAS